jgi:hypothetical protein
MRDNMAALAAAAVKNSRRVIMADSSVRAPVRKPRSLDDGHAVVSRKSDRLLPDRIAA